MGFVFMTIEEIRKNAPELATHYGYDEDEIVYLNHIQILGYWNGNYYLDEYEVYLFKVKPLY